MATQREVLDLHCEHPTWNANDIAQQLDCSAGYVRATARRLNITLPRATPESIEALGHAARDAGLTVADIERLAKRRLPSVAAAAALITGIVFSSANLISKYLGASL